jgi:hypothetical protein
MMLTGRPRRLWRIRLRNRRCSTLPEALVGSPALGPIVDESLPLMSRLVRSVGELAAEVCDAAGDDAAARLRAAIDTRRELTKIGNSLVERFVVEARLDGLSWTRVGKLLATSRRAAEKRYSVSVLAGTWSAEFADRFAGP